MSKNKKIICLIIGIILIIGLITGIGVKKYMEHKKIEEQKIIEQFKPSIEIYLKTYYNNIDTVTVDNVERVPTGSTCLNGYVNGDKELSIFSFIHFIEENGVSKPVIKEVDVNVKLNDWEKEEYINSDKHYPAYQLLEQRQAKEKKEK
ncbi:DUF1433 domain-containing protein (plasmid) [Paraclostridium ghonii]|uniref:DUF1433 domain-containing protein n=1 Tax=Paraclostridium ghonii TaxID=29358 RepID=UPI00202CE03E|nr:DUF1433 domain-containing protein [Paeniclostridium ghonii]MCM0166610.1 DUF1433 domain-containing protein [Paeniclostridium ghonii]